MPAPRRTKDRLVPYRVLTYMLYGNPQSIEWVSHLGGSRIKVDTGLACKEMRVKSSQFWELLYWLKDNELIEKVEKARKRGAALITLRQPINVREDKQEAELEAAKEMF